MGNIQLVTKARELYSLGLTKGQIASQLDVSSTNVSKWCMTIVNKNRNNYVGIVKQQIEERKRFYNLDQIKLSKINISQARLYASIFYWCEGAKYPSSSKVNFTSSDIDMQILFWSLMRKGFILNDKKLSVWLQVHTSHDLPAIIKLWSDSLKIPPEQFIKPRITIMRGGKYRQIYYGTCSVRYADYRVQLRLMGIYKRFSSKAMNLLV